VFIKNKIEFHFDGDITTDHKISIRTLSKTVARLQVALDRAYMDQKYGGIWKHSKMLMADYDEMDFLIGESREGGFILDFINETEAGKKALKRLADAIRKARRRAEQDGVNNTKTITEQFDDRNTQVIREVLKPITYLEMLESPSQEIIRAYGDRSINKEVNQLLSLIRSTHAGQSSFELTLSAEGEKNEVFYFDRAASNSFDQVVSKRSLGDPVIYQARVIKLDSDNASGQVKNTENGKKSTIHFRDKDSFREARGFLGEDEIVNFIGCPVIEDGAYDPTAGDIYFIKLVD
jgi:hypothetical protein